MYKCKTTRDWLRKALFLSLYLNTVQETKWLTTLQEWYHRFLFKLNIHIKLKTNTIIWIYSYRRLKFGDSKINSFNNFDSQWGRNWYLRFIVLDIASKWDIELKGNSKYTNSKHNLYNTFIYQIMKTIWIGDSHIQKDEFSKC